MAFAGANRVIDAAREIQDFCTAKRWSFCFIGAIAVQRWGQPRLTRDADLNVFTGIGDEPRYIDELLAHFAGRIDTARDFALRHRVLLLRAANGVPIDVSLGAFDFEEQAAATASLEEVVPGTRLRVASPSALVVFKAFADRAQDWLDIEGIDLKGDRSALDKLAALRKHLGAN